MHHVVDVPTDDPTRQPLARHLEWVAPALVSLTLSASMIGRSTMGRDEMATWEFAQLSLADLIRAVSHVDAVLAPYYLFAGLWTSVDDGAVWLRLPSAIATAAAVAVAARTGGRAWGPWAGAVTGLALALHPAVVAEAVQARPYALALLFCTIGTAQVLADGPVRWRRYVLVMGTAVALHLFAVTVVVAHLVIVRRRTFLLPAAAVAAIAIPLALAAHAQRIQVIYLELPTWSLTVEALRQMAAPGHYLWVAVGAAAAIVVSAAAGRTAAFFRSLLPGLMLVLIPIALLVVASHLITPVLNPRYLITAPLGTALVIGAAAGLVQRPRWLSVPWAVGVVLAIVGATGPAVRAVHAPHDQGVDYVGLARILAQQAHPGDGLQLVIRRSQGGMVAGVAYYTGDRAFVEDVLSGLPVSEPLRYQRRITGPGASVADAGLRPTTWMLGVVGEQSARGVRILVDHGCQIVTHYPLGQLALYRAQCPSDQNDRVLRTPVPPRP